MYITGEAERLVEPALEPQVPHATTLEAVRLELGGAAEDTAAKIAKRPSGRGAEVEGGVGAQARRSRRGWGGVGDLRPPRAKSKSSKPWMVSVVGGHRWWRATVAWCLAVLAAVVRTLGRS